MSFKTFFLNYHLMEGGAALKAKPITQSGAKAAIKELIPRVAKVLGIPLELVIVVGSAGKKPSGQLSGDIDLAVQAEADAVQAALPRLAYDGKTHRWMPGVGVGAFAHMVDGQPAQVDLIVTTDLELVKWSMQAHPDDLAAGLKGAHRNELFFALARHVGWQQRSKLEASRYFYDFRRGLSYGVVTYKHGKYNTVSRDSLGSCVTDPVEITKRLFGPTVTPEQVSSFDGALSVINSTKFAFPTLRDQVIRQAIDGIKSKGLTVPQSLKA